MYLLEIVIFHPLINVRAIKDFTKCELLEHLFTHNCQCCPPLVIWTRTWEDFQREIRYSDLIKLSEIINNITAQIF